MANIKTKRLNNRPWKHLVIKSRHKIAMARQALRDALSPLQQLQELDKRLGNGIGAVRERTRLNKLLEAK